MIWTFVGRHDATFSNEWSKLESRVWKCDSFVFQYVGNRPCGVRVTLSIPVLVMNVIEQWPQLLISVRFYSFLFFFFPAMTLRCIFCFVCVNKNEEENSSEMRYELVQFLQSSIRKITTIPRILSQKWRKKKDLFERQTNVQIFS